MANCAIVVFVDRLEPLSIEQGVSTSRPELTT